MLDAAQIVGLNCLRLMNDMTAGKNKNALLNWNLNTLHALIKPVWLYMYPESLLRKH